MLSAILPLGNTAEGGVVGAEGGVVGAAGVVFFTITFLGFFAASA